MFHNSKMGLGLFSLVVLTVMSYSSVDAFFTTSLAGFTSDIIKSPLESLSLFALKSYLLGHLGGRVTQYRQMMYNANRPQGSVQYNGRTPLDNQYYNVHNRQRRSLEELEIEEQQTSQEQDDVTVDQFLEIAEKLDMNKCIPRLICEVMAGSSVTEGGQFKDLVVKVFGDEMPEVNGDQKMFRSIYHYAAFTGKRAEQPDQCQQIFPKCKASDKEFVKIADKIFSGVDNETEDDQ